MSLGCCGTRPSASVSPALSQTQSGVDRVIKVAVPFLLNICLSLAVFAKNTVNTVVAIAKTRIAKRAFDASGWLSGFGRCAALVPLACHFTKCDAKPHFSRFFNIYHTIRLTMRLFLPDQTRAPAVNCIANKRRQS
jgi:hypothetical protein